MGAAPNILGLITARGGSKGLPGKNIRSLCGRPLLAWTCDAALGARSLSRVILSTDREEIAAVGRECGVEVPFSRPESLSGDEASSLAVARHAIDFCADHDWVADAVVILQPTSPLRTAADIDAALALLTDGVDTVVSVMPVPHRFSPLKMMRLEGDDLVDLIEPAVGQERFRRQAQPRVFARNGPAVLASRTSVIRAGSFYGRHVRPYVMAESDSIDIDTLEDFQLAEARLKVRLAGA